jgi:NAD(P)-dependent dehydrogenase (short-subunit alcohol dehydrogenase family)
MPESGSKREARVAIINGASRGIGFEAAACLAREGWNVAITARKAEPLESSAEQLRGLGAEVLALPGAVDDEEHQQATVSAVMDRWGRIDALVNNVATSPHLGVLTDATTEQLMRAMWINLAAPFAWSRLAWHAWLGEHGGAIVNVASIGGTYPVPRVGLYNVSKAALIHLTRQMALEMAPSVRVNSVSPATIKTRFSRAKYEGREADVADQYPLKRLGTAEEVGDVIAMLCTGRLGWITGQNIVLDGGSSIIQGVV